MTFEQKRQLLLQQIRCAPVKVNDELRTLEPQTMTPFSSDSQFPKTRESRDVTGTRKSGRFRVGSGTRTRPEIFIFPGRFRVPGIEPELIFQLRVESSAY